MPPYAPVHPDDVAALVAKSAQLRERYELALRELDYLREVERRAELRADSTDPVERASALWILGRDRRAGRHRTP